MELALELNRFVEARITTGVGPGSWARANAGATSGSAVGFNVYAAMGA